ncbi:hypothetical protein [Ruminococcus sp. NK3A76]|uniref:hypothetical protein n=1 Tax=Ruminococcus sp. NK3A76 TaxID=877411 RepID=UPI00048BE468|nr:hypothetical protein [Ruminococcus sp. NK3A76]
MRDIEKLLHEIPLDELMGETDTEIMTQPIICEEGGKQHGAARVKTHKAGAFVAVAAAMALVVGGAAYWGMSRNKLNPMSYNSKNGVSSPTENQNRSLIEQNIEKCCGDPKLWGDRLVAFDKNIIPQYYLDDVEDVDFQILGYTYSGQYAQVYFAFENRKAEFYLSKYEDDPDSIEGTVQHYEAEIKKATEEGDYQRAKYLIEHKPEGLVDGEISYTRRSFEFSKLQIKNSSGEIIAGTNIEDSYTICSYQQLGDYSVWYENIDMSKAPDKKLTFECEFGNRSCKPITFKLDKYENDGYTEINCDAPTIVAFQSSAGEVLDARVSRISYSTGNTVIELETDKKLADNEKIVKLYGSFIHLENGAMFSGDVVVPVYDDNSSPFSNSFLTSYQENGKIYLVFVNASMPMDISRLESFIVGTARVNKDGTSVAPYGVLGDPSPTMTDSYADDQCAFIDSINGEVYSEKYNGKDTYFITNGLDKIQSLVDSISSYDEIDPSGFEAVIPQTMKLTVYDENGSIKYIIEQVLMLKEYNKDTTDYSNSVKAIRINGKCLKVSEKEYAQFGEYIEKLRKNEL